MEGEAYLIRYIDDFIVCFRYGRDGERFQAVLSRRLNTFHLALESTKTRLIAFGRGLLSETSSNRGRSRRPCISSGSPTIAPGTNGGLHAREENREVAGAADDSAFASAHARNSP